LPVLSTVGCHQRASCPPYLVPAHEQLGLGVLEETAHVGADERVAGEIERHEHRERGGEVLPVLKGEGKRKREKERERGRERERELDTEKERERGRERKKEI
jgi:hypothetical protein